MKNINFNFEGKVLIFKDKGSREYSEKLEPIVNFISNKYFNSSKYNEKFQLEVLKLLREQLQEFIKKIKKL